MKRWAEMTEEERVNEIRDAIEFHDYDCALDDAQLEEMAARVLEMMHSLGAAP